MADQEKVTKALEIYQKTEAARDQAEENMQKALAQLRETAGQSTFEVAGQYYQIRERKGVLYLCKLDGPPKGRPKKPKTAEAVAKEQAQDKSALN